MGRFDDLPKRDRNHVLEELAMTAFQRRLTQSGAFLLQGVDRKDYGADCLIEAVDDDCASNARVQVQLKRTERDLNEDGSVAIEVARTNLNYLMMQKHSLYVCYHAPTDTLLCCPVDHVLRQYDRGGTGWTRQKTVTVKFRDELTVDRLRSLAALVLKGTMSSRDRRNEQVVSDAASIPSLLRKAVPTVHVPSDRRSAAELLKLLYESGADDVISAAFDEFVAVLGAEDDAMGPGYMAEVNRGMDGRNPERFRIERAVDHFRSKLSGGRYQPGSLHYTLGNAFSALGDEVAAKQSYEAAVADRRYMGIPSLAAQVMKNLGTSVERLGDPEGAIAHYAEALRLDPDLPEAHNALGNYYVRVGRFEEALEHFDRSIFLEGQAGRASAVAGWKVNALFNLGDGRAAFREINSLLVRADLEPWIWPWCARQVGSFGRATPENARHALMFWRRFVVAHPEIAEGQRELMLVAFIVRREGGDIGGSYFEFHDEMERHIDRFDSDDAAFLWDRLGHWAIGPLGSGR